MSASEDLKKMGFSEIRGKVSVLEGEEFVSLKSMEGVKTVFDEKKLSLELTADPQLLGKQIFTLRYPRQAKVYYPKDIGGFLNYNLTFFARRFLYLRQNCTDQSIGFSGRRLSLPLRFFLHSEEEVKEGSLFG